MLEQFLVDARTVGVPSKLIIVRSDGGDDFLGGKFGDLCLSRGIKQELTKDGSPQFNGIPQHALGLIKIRAESKLVSVFPAWNHRQLRCCEQKRLTGRATRSYF